MSSASRQDDAEAGRVLHGRLVTLGAGELATGVPPLLTDALLALDADLGAKCVGWQHGEDGRKHRVYRRRLELLAETLEPRTLAVVVRWLGSARRSSAATRKGYADDLLTVWAPLAAELGHDRFALGQLSAADLELWQMRNKQAPPRTIKRYTASLSGLYAYAAGVLDPPPRNPVTEDVRPLIDEEDQSTATPILELEEVAAVAAQAVKLADLVLIALLYILAGRISEICNADVEDVHTQGRRSYLRVTRKGHQVRDLEIPLALAELIDRYLDGRTHGPLLLNSEGQRMSRRSAAYLSAWLGRAAGVLPGRDLTPHVWRASRITHMLDALGKKGGEAGVMAGLPQVMIYANHKDSATTLRYWIRRNKTETNAKLATTGEQVLAQIMQTWLPRPTPMGEAFLDPVGERGN